MKTKTMLRLGTAVGAAVAAVAAVTATSSAATAAPNHFRDGDGAQSAVFVQTDNVAGNQIVAYHRDAFGQLTQAGTYDTGGLGGVLAGSVVDHLASQGSLAYDSRGGLLIAVNAGSDAISVFQASGDRLALRQVLPSGGTFPVSVAVHGNLVYVLNALDGGSIQGFVQFDGRLIPIGAWHRSLGLDPAAKPQFTHTPGQIGFTADGSKLVVTTKAGANTIDVFPLGLFGTPAAAPVVTSLPGTVPFAFVTDSADRLIVAEAGTNAVAAFTVAADGTLVPGSTVATGQAATCWISSTGAFVYTGNAGSASLSGFAPQADGSFPSLGNTTTDPGTVDSAATANGQFLYAQTGAKGIVDEFAVGQNGSLTSVGSVTVPNAAGGEGIVAF